MAGRSRSPIRWGRNPHHYHIDEPNLNPPRPFRGEAADRVHTPPRAFRGEADDRVLTPPRPIPAEPLRIVHPMAKAPPALPVPALAIRPRRRIQPQLVGPEEAQRLMVGADATVAQDRRALRVRAKMWGAGVLVKPPAPMRPMAKAEGIVAAPAIPKVRAEVFWPRPGPPITVEEAAARLARLTLDVPAEVGDDAGSENGSEDSEATLLLG